MFKSALIKLTMWYLAAIVGLCLFFSFLLYQLSTREISTGINNQFKRIEIDVYGNVVKNHSMTRQINPDDEITLRSHHLFVSLLYFNVFASCIAGIGSYALAKRALEPLEVAHEQQARFTSDVSHELRTPLSAMKTESEVALIDPTLSNEELRSILKSNLEEIDKMQSLTNNLLRISKLENQDLKKLFINVNLDKIVSAARKNNMKSADKKGLVINLHADKLQILGNEENLIQAISILIDNAIKYSNHDSSIDLIVRKRKSDAIIEVKDHGIGISSQDMPYIFDRFYRAERSRAKEPGTDNGYGLGLPLAKFIIELHDGSITISSNLNKGTNILIRLPISKN